MGFLHPFSSLSLRICEYPDLRNTINVYSVNESFFGVNFIFSKSVKPVLRSVWFNHELDQFSNSSWVHLTDPVSRSSVNNDLNKLLLWYTVMSQKGCFDVLL